MIFHSKMKHKNYEAFKILLDFIKIIKVAVQKTPLRN